MASKCDDQTDNNPTQYSMLEFGSGPMERLFFLVSKLLKNVTVEPLCFLHALGMSMVMIVSPMLYFDKTCRVSIYILILPYNMTFLTPRAI